MPTFSSGVALESRTQIANTAVGVLAEPAPITGYGATNIPATNAASGSLTLTLVGLRAGDVVTNILVPVTTNGSGITFAKCGIYTSAGVFIAATASASASFNAGTANRLQSVALTAPTVIPVTGGYYLAYLQWGSGATGATLARNSSSISAAVTGSVRRYAQVANATDINADITPADPVTNYWLGCN